MRELLHLSKKDPDNPKIIWTAGPLNSEDLHTIVESSYDQPLFLLVNEYLTREAEAINNYYQAEKERVQGNEPVRGELINKARLKGFSAVIMDIQNDSVSKEAILSRKIDPSRRDYVRRKLKRRKSVRGETAGFIEGYVHGKNRYHEIYMAAEETGAYTDRKRLKTSRTETVLYRMQRAVEEHVLRRKLPDLTELQL